MTDIKSDSIWVYKDREYKVNSVLINNLSQDPQNGDWMPTVRYTLNPPSELVFYRSTTEWIRKFTPKRESSVALNQ